MSAVKSSKPQSKILALADCWQKPIDVQQTIAVSDELMPGEVIRAVKENQLHHIVQRKNPHYDSEIVAAETMIFNPQSFLADPLQTIFGASASPRTDFTRTLDVNSKKSELLTEFGNFVASLARSRTIWDQSLLVVDELFTNSAKNGWDPGKKPFTMPARHKGQIDFFAQASADRLVVGCRDSFGAMDVMKVLRRIATCYEKGLADSIRRDSAGAGIGSYMVFEACLSYYAGVEKDKQTVVCVALPLGLSRRAGANLAKNVHLLPSS